MQAYKNMIWAGAGLAALLFALDISAELGDSPRPSRVNRVPLTAIDWPHLTPDTALPPERWYARDATPAIRIREAFAQFMPGEGRRRYSALESVTQE